MNKQTKAKLEKVLDSLELSKENKNKKPVPVIYFYLIVNYQT